MLHSEDSRGGGLNEIELINTAHAESWGSAGLAGVMKTDTPLRRWRQTAAGGTVEEDAVALALLVAFSDFGSEREGELMHT